MPHILRGIYRLSRWRLLPFWRTLVRQHPVPRLWQRLLLSGAVVFVTTAIGVGISVSDGQPQIAILWFSGAALSSTIAVFLWDEFTSLDLTKRVIHTVTALLLILLCVRAADSWVLGKVQQAAQNRIEEAAQASKLAALNKTTPPDNKAKMEIQVYDAGGKIIRGRELSVPLLGDRARVSFTARVIGDVIPKDGSIWVRICDSCRYGEKSNGFLPDNDDPHLTSIAFRLLYLYPVVLPKMTVEVLPPTGIKKFELGFFYTCENCDRIDQKNIQKVIVDLSTLPGPTPGP